MSQNKETIYCIIGIKQIVGQIKIGGPFVTDYSREVVRAFRSQEDADNYIAANMLSKPKKESYSGKQYYKGGFYELVIEEVELY